MASPIKASLTPGAGGQSQQSAAPDTETFLPRGLSAANNTAITSITGAADPSPSAATSCAVPLPAAATTATTVTPLTTTATETNGAANWNASSSSVYAHMSTNTTSTSGTYDKPPPFANSSYYGQTLSGGLGITTTATATTSATATNGSSTSISAVPMPIRTPSAPHGLPSTYKPVPVPQVSPYTTGSLAGASYDALTNGSHSHSITNAGKFGQSSSSSSSHHHHHLLHHHSSNGHSKHSSSSTEVIGGGKNPFTASGASSGLAMTQHQHAHHGRTAFRVSLREIWRSLKESEREQIGQFERWAEVEGMCRDCFEPGSSAADAPRKHHINERWDAKRRVWVSRRRSMGLWGGLGWRKGSGSSSDGTSSSTSSSDSSSDGGISSATRKRKAIRYQIRHERRIERRRRREEERRSATQSSRLVGIVGRALGVSSSSSSSSSIKQSPTKIVRPSALSTGLRANRSATGKSSSVFYDPGYGADGTPHPHYYVEEESVARSRKPHDGVYQNHKHSKSSTSIIGSIFGSSSSKRDKGKSRWVDRSKNSSRSSVFSSPSSSSDDGLAYGSSVGSKSTGGGGIWGRWKNHKATSVTSSDALAYGDHYSTSSDGPWGSFSPKKPAPTSMAGSIKSSLWGSRKDDRRSSWAAVTDRRQSNGSSYRGNNDAAFMAGSAALTRHNSTGGTRASAISRSGFSTTRRHSSTSLHGAASGRLSRQPSNSSGWMGDSSVGSRRSSSSGNSLFEGGVAHDKKKEKRTANATTTTTSGRSWWTLGLRRQKTTTAVASAKPNASGRRTKSPESYSSDSSLTSSSDDTRHSHKSVSRRASAVAALGGGLFGFSGFGRSSKSKQQQSAGGAGSYAGDRNGMRVSNRENLYGAQGQTTSRFDSTTNVSTSAATPAGYYPSRHPPYMYIPEQTDSYQPPFPQQQQQYTQQWQQQPIQQIPHQRHEQHQQSGSTATVITGAAPSTQVTRVGAPGEVVRPIPLPVQKHEQKPVAAVIPATSSSSMTGKVVAVDSVVNRSHRHSHQHASHTSSSSTSVSAPSVQVQPAIISYVSSGSRLVSTSAGHVSEASSTSTSSSSSDSSSSESGDQRVWRGTASGVRTGVGIGSSEGAVAGGSTTTSTKITKTEARKSSRASPLGAVMGAGAVLGKGAVMGGEVVGSGGVSSTVIGGSVSSASSSRTITEGGSSIKFGSSAIMGGGSTIATEKSSRDAIAESTDSSQSSRFLTGAPALAIGAFTQPARHFIQMDSPPPVPTGRMSLQEQLRLAALAAESAPRSTGVRLRAAANASRIAADQLRQEQEAVKARRDQELADQARQDTIRRKLEDERRLDELAKEKIREIERQKESERARIDELEKAAIRQAIIVREKRAKEIAAAEKWRAEREAAEREREVLEAGIVEHGQRESVAVEEGLVHKQRSESVTVTPTVEELHTSSSSSVETVRRDVSRGRAFERDQATTSYTSASDGRTIEERGREQTWTERQIQQATEAKAQESANSTSWSPAMQAGLELIEQDIASSTEKLESTAVLSTSEETEENRLSRQALERQKAELEAMIVEERRRSVKERRRRERSSDEYKKKERRRQRESSRDREAERAEARRQEVEYVREKLGLGPIVKDTPSKKAIIFTDDEKEAMIDRFGTWENWAGTVPRLIEIPPTPKPGAARTVPVVLCEGKDYFGAAKHEASSAPETTYPIMTAPGTPSISISGPDDVPELPSLSHEPEIISAEPEIVVAEPDFDGEFTPTGVSPIVPFNPPAAGVESGHGSNFVPTMPSTEAHFHGPELPPAGAVGENASYYSGEVAQNVKKSEEIARMAQYHRDVEETTEAQRSQVERNDISGGSRQDYYAMVTEVEQQLEHIKSEERKKEEQEKRERWGQGTKGGEKFRAPGFPSIASVKPSITPATSAPQVHRIADFQQDENVDVEGRTSDVSHEGKTGRKSLDSERERLQHILKHTETALAKSETTMGAEERRSLDSITPHQRAPTSPEDPKKDSPNRSSMWNLFRKEKTPAVEKKGPLGWYATAQKLRDATMATASTSIPEASSVTAQAVTATPSSESLSSSASSASRLPRPVSALETHRSTASTTSSSISSSGYRTAGSTTPTQTPRGPAPVNYFAESKPPSELDVFDEPDVVAPTPKQQEAAEFRAITAMAAESAGYSEDIVRKVVNEEHEDAHRSNGKTTTAFVANFDDYEYDRKKRAAKRIPDSELEKGGKHGKAAFGGIEYQRKMQVSQESSLSTSFDAREMLQHYDSQKQSSTSSESADFRTGQLAGFGTDRATKQTRNYSEREQEHQSAAARFEASQQLQRQDGQWTQFTTSPIMPVGFDHEQRYEQERQSTGGHQARLVRTERQQENRTAISPASTAFDARELLQRYDSVQQSLEASQQLQRQDGQWTQFTTSPAPSWGFDQQQQQQKQHYEHDHQSAGKRQTGFEETERQHQHSQETHTAASHVSAAFDARELVLQRNDSQETQVSDRVAIGQQEGPSRYSDHSTSVRAEQTQPSAERVDTTQNFEQERRSSSQFDATQQLQNQDGQWTQASTSPTLPWGFDQQAQELYRQERRSAQIGTVGQDEHQMDTVQIKQYQEQQRQTQTDDHFSSAARVEERREHRQQDFVATSPVSTAFDARQLLQNYDSQRQSLEASQQLQRQDGQWTQFTTSPAPSWGFDQQQQQQKSQHAVPSTSVGLEAGPIVQYQEPRQDRPLEPVKPEPLSVIPTAPAGLAISQQQEEHVAISPVSTAFDARQLLQRYDSVQQSLEASQQLQRQDGQWTQFTTSPAPSWGFDQQQQLQQQKSRYIVPSTSAEVETGQTQFAVPEVARQYHERPSVFDRQEEQQATTSPVSTAFDARQLLQRYDSMKQSLEASQPLQRQDGQWTQFTTSPTPSWGFDQQQQQQQQKSQYIVPSTSAEVETGQTQFAVPEVARQYQERASVFSESESQSVVPTAPAGLGISQPTELETQQGEEEHATSSPVSTAFDARQLLQRYDSIQQSLEASQPLQRQDGQWTQFTTSPAPSWGFDQQQQQQKSLSEHAQQYQKTHQERPLVVMPESQSAAPAGLAISQQTGLEVRTQEEHVATSPVSTAFDARQLLQRYDSQPRSFEASQQLQRQDGQWTQFTTSPMLPLEGDAFQQDGQTQQRQTASQTTSSTKVNTLQDYSRPSSSSELRLGQQHRNEQRHEQQRHKVLQEQEYSSVESGDEEEQRYEDTVEKQEASTGLGLRGGYLHRRDRHGREFAETTEKRKKKERRNVSASREVSQEKSSSNRREVETVSSESVESTQQQKQSHHEVTAVAQSVKGRVSTQESTQSRQYDEKRRDGYRETSQQQATTERLPYVSQETKPYDARSRYEQTTGATAYVSMPSPATGGYITQLATPIEQWTSGGYLASAGAPPCGTELSQTKFEQFYSSQPAVQEWETQLAQEKVQQELRRQETEIEHRTAASTENTQKIYSPQAAVGKQEVEQLQYEQRSEIGVPAIASATVTSKNDSQPATAIGQWTSSGYLANAGAELLAESENAYQDNIQSSQSAILEWNQRTHDHEVVENSSQSSPEARYEKATGAPAYVPMPVPATGYSRAAAPVEQWTPGGYLANSGFELHGTQSGQHMSIATSTQSSQPAIAEWEALQAARQSAQAQYQRHQEMESAAFTPALAETTQSYSSQPAVAEWNARQLAQYDRYHESTEASGHIPLPAPTTGGYISQPATPSEEWTSGGYLANTGVELPYIPHPTQRERERHQDATPVPAERSHISTAGERNACQSQYERHEDNEAAPVMPWPTLNYSSQPAVAEWEARQQQYANRSRSETRQCDETDQQTPRQRPTDIQMPSPTAETHTDPSTTLVEEYTASEPGWAASIPLLSQTNSEASNAPSRRQRRVSSTFSETTTVAESGTTYSVISHGAASTVPTSIDDLEAFEHRRESRREYDDSTDSESDEEVSGEDMEDSQQTAPGEDGPNLGLRGGDGHRGRRRHRTKEEKAASKKRREARREEMRLREERGEDKQQSRLRGVSRSQSDASIDSTSRPAKEMSKQSAGDGSWSRFLNRFVSPASEKAPSLRRAQTISEKTLRKSTSDLSLGDKTEKKIQLQRGLSGESWEEIQKEGEDKIKRKHRTRRSSEVEDIVSPAKTSGNDRSTFATVTPLPADLDERIAKLKTGRTEEEKILGLRGGDLKDDGKQKKRMDILTYLEEKEKEQERKKKKALKEKERAEREKKREKKERRRVRKEEQRKSAGEAVAESSEEEQEGVTLGDDDLSESETDEASYAQTKHQVQAGVGTYGNGNNGVSLLGAQLETKSEQIEVQEGSEDEKKVAVNRSGRKEENEVVEDKFWERDRLSDVEEEGEEDDVSHVLAFAPVSRIKSAGSRYVLPSSALSGDLPSVRFSLPGETQPVLPNQSPALQKPSETVLPEEKSNVLKPSVHEDTRLSQQLLDETELQKESPSKSHSTQAPTIVSDVIPLSPAAIDGEAFSRISSPRSTNTEEYTRLAESSERIDGEERQYPLHLKLQQPEYMQLPESEPASPYELPKPQDGFAVSEQHQLAYESESESTVVLSNADTEEVPLHLKLQRPEYVMLPDSRPGSPYELPGIPWWLPHLPASPIDSPTQLPQLHEEKDTDIEELPIHLRLQQPEYVMLPDSPLESPTQWSQLQHGMFEHHSLKSVSEEENEEIVERIIELSPPSHDTPSEHGFGFSAGLERTPSPEVLSVSDEEELPLHLKLQRPEYVMLPDSNPGSPYELPGVPWWLPALPDSPIDSPTQLPTRDEEAEDVEELPLHLRLQQPEYVMLPDSAPGSPTQLPKLADGVPKALQIAIHREQKEDDVDGLIGLEDVEELPLHLRLQRPEYVMLPDSRPDSPYEIEEVHSPLPAPASPIQQPLKLQDSILQTIPFAQDEKRKYDVTGTIGLEDVEELPLHLRLQQPEYVMLPDSTPGSPYELSEVPWDLPALPESAPSSPMQKLQVKDAIPVTFSLTPQDQEEEDDVARLVGLQDAEALPLHLRLQRPEYVMLPDSRPGSPYETEKVHSPLPAPTSPIQQLPKLQDSVLQPLPFAIQDEQREDDVAGLIGLEDAEELPLHLRLQRPEYVMLPDSTPGSPYELSKLQRDLPVLPESVPGSPTQALQAKGAVPVAFLPAIQDQEEKDDVAMLVGLEDAEELPLYLKLQRPEYVMLPDSTPGSPYELSEIPWYLPALPESAPSSPIQLPQDSGSKNLPLAKHEDNDFSPMGSPRSTNTEDEEEYSWWAASPEWVDCDERQYPLHLKFQQPEYVMLPDSNPGSPYEPLSPPCYLPPLPESPMDSPTQPPKLQLSVPEKLHLDVLQPQGVTLPLSNPASPYEQTLPWDLPALPESPFTSPTQLPQKAQSSVARSPIAVAKQTREEDGETGGVSLVYGGLWKKAVRHEKQQKTMQKVVSNFTLRDILRPVDVPLPASRPGSPYELPAVPWYLPPLPESPLGSSIQTPQSQIPVLGDLSLLTQQIQEEASLTASSLQQAYQGNSWSVGSLEAPSDEEPPLYLRLQQPDYVMLPDSSPGSPYELPAVPWYLPPLPESPLDSPTLLPEDAPLPDSDPSSPYLLPAVPSGLPALPPSRPDSPTLELLDSVPSSPVPPTEQAGEMDVPRVASPVSDDGVGGVPLVFGGMWKKAFQQEKKQQMLRRVASVLREPLRNHLRAVDVPLPASRPGSPYELPALPWYLPPLPRSPNDSPALLSNDWSRSPSEPSSPYFLAADAPEMVELPESWPASPYSLPEVPANLPLLPDSPWYSPTLEPSPLDVDIPESRPESPYDLPMPAYLPMLPESRASSPTLLPENLSLPSTRDGSPYMLPVVPNDLPELPESPWYSPTLGPSPLDIDLPESRSTSPYQLPAIPSNLPRLPLSPWNSPTLGPGPQDIELPESECTSPYQLPAVPTDLPMLPGSPWDSPTLLPAPQDLDLPSSRPDSPYVLPAIPDDLPQLPSSPFGSPTLLPQDVELPESVPGSPYSLSAVPDDLPDLPPSPWDLPTLGPAPQDMSLPCSRSTSPYVLPAIPDDLPQLPESGWNSPTLGPSPTEVELPGSAPGSPYILPLVGEELPPLPDSPWNSPTFGPRPTETDVPVSRPDSPHQLLPVPLELPALPKSPWHSPAFDPRPQEVSLSTSRPNSSPWDSRMLGPRPQEVSLPFSKPGSPSPWDSPTLGPRPQEVAAPPSQPGLPYQLPDAAEQGLPVLPSSPTLLPRPEDTELPFSHPGSPYQLSDIMPTWVPGLPNSPWNSPTLGPAPTEKELPLSTPGSPYEFTLDTAALPPLPESPRLDPVQEQIVEEPPTEVAIPSPPPPSEASSAPRRKLWRKKSGLVKTQPEVAEEKEDELEELKLVPSRTMSIKEEEVAPPSPTGSIDDKKPPGPKRKGSFWNRVWKTAGPVASPSPSEAEPSKSRPGTPTGGGVGILSAFASTFAAAKNESNPLDTPARAPSVWSESEEVRAGVSLQPEDSGSEYSEYKKKTLEEEEQRNNSSRVVAIEDKADEVLELNIWEDIQKANRKYFDAQKSTEEWTLVDSATGSPTEEFDQEAAGVLLDHQLEPVSVYNLQLTTVSEEAKSVYQEKPPAFKPTHTEIAEEIIDRTHSQSQTLESSTAAPTLSAASAVPTYDRPATPVLLTTLPEQFSPLLSSDDEASLGVSLAEDDLSQRPTPTNQLPSTLESAASTTLVPPTGATLESPPPSAESPRLDHQSPLALEISPEFLSELGSSTPDPQTVGPSVQEPPTPHKDLGKPHPQENPDSTISSSSSISSAFTSSYSSAGEGSVLVSIEADPGYEVSVQRIPSSESRRRGSIGVKISQLVGKFEELQPQSSTDSLRSFASSRSATPPETKEVAPKEPYKSLFGGPSSEDNTAFKPPAAKEAGEKSELSLARRHSNFELKPSTTSHSPIVSPTHVSFPLPTITEASAEHERPIKSLQRTATENSFFRPPPPPTRAETFKQYENPTAGSRFITADDILRLQSDVPRRAKSAIWATRPPELQEDEKMQVLKRGERASKAPSLRRVGSQIESPRTSAEYVIFGERFTTPVRPGSAHDKTRDDILEAWGEQHPQPSSPTRPPSIRRRQSLKLMDLEQKVELLGSENSTLLHEKANLVKSLAKTRADQQEATAALTQKLESADKVLADKNAEIDELTKKLAWYQEEMARLQGDNATLTKLQAAYKLSHASISTRYDKKSQQLLELTNEHTELQARYKSLQEQREHSQAVADEIQAKDAELQLLRSELQKARDEVRSLERKVMSRQSNRYLDIKDPSHFADSASVLFQEVQKWSEDFSHFSLGRRCIHVHRVTDEEIKNRFENVMLDDRGVRRMLKDEAQRGTAITAIMMRLIWEFVFTRYLFGLETEERQKLLSLERTLAEVGAPPAVHQWRATTLTLLSQRHSFRSLLTSATEATVNDIMRHLNLLLPPPPQHAAMAISTLRAMLNHAVKLALEMRTQRAEYVMLRPPFPEYDDLGEVSNTVYFNAARMKAVNSDASPFDLEAEHATVKMVLFPLIIRHGNEFGEEYDREHVVCQMQVLITRAQLRSESRCSSMRSVASSVGSSIHGHSWRDGQSSKQAVSRLTPITDHSPRTTPDPTRRERDESPEPLPKIPEQTIRLVDDSDGEMDVDDEKFRDFDMPPRYESNLGKKRRISGSGDQWQR